MAKMDFGGWTPGGQGPDIGLVTGKSASVGSRSLKWESGEEMDRGDLLDTDDMGMLCGKRLKVQPSHIPDLRSGQAQAVIQVETVN